MWEFMKTKHLNELPQYPVTYLNIIMIYYYQDF